MTILPTRITFIRHGHVHNPEDVIYGRLPGFGLSDAGRAQVLAAASVLEGATLAAIYTSPQLRATQTAELIARHHRGIKVTTAPLIDEIRTYFEGHPSCEVEARGWDLYTGVAPGYEVPLDIAERGGCFVRETRTRHPGEHIAVATHGDVIAFTVLWAMQQPVRVDLKRTLDRFGITDSYPATGSLTTFVYRTCEPAEVPVIDYVRPYGDDLTLPSLS